MEAFSTVLDIATGTGFVAVEFARKTSGLVVGSDITSEMIGWARKHSDEQSVSDHAVFLIADGASQPFRDGSFDNVVSRLALHHIKDPESIVEEMTRLARAGGRVVVADQISPEDDNTARFHDEFERFRDPSHQRALKLSELQSMFKNAGLRVTGQKYSDVFLEMEDWAVRAGCTPDKISRLRSMLLEANTNYRKAFEIHEEAGQVLFKLQRVILAGTR